MERSDRHGRGRFFRHRFEPSQRQQVDPNSDPERREHFRISVDHGQQRLPERAADPCGAERGALGRHGRPDRNHSRPWDQRLCALGRRRARFRCIFCRRVGPGTHGHDAMDGEPIQRRELRRAQPAARAGAAALAVCSGSAGAAGHGQRAREPGGGRDYHEAERRQRTREPGHRGAAPASQRRKRAHFSSCN